MTLLLLILLILCIYLTLRVRATKKIVSQLIEAAGHAEPLLLEQSSSLLRTYRLDELVGTFNRLIADRAQISDTGEGYHKQIQALLGNLREAVVMVDNDNRILSANRAFRELTLLKGETRGKRLDACFSGPAFIEFLNRVKKDNLGRQSVLEVEIQQRNYWVEVSAAPLLESPDESGHYTLLVFQDITRQKKLEMMRTEFVANVSHELRTPVTIIKGFAETLIDDDAELSRVDRIRFLRKILTNSERLNSLIQDLLLLSRLESTDTVLRKESIQLNTFLSELVNGWKPSNGTEIPIELELGKGNDTIEADPLRLSQVVSNLLENATRHAHGLTRITLRTRLEDESVTIDIEDDGDGIPEKDLPHIFERFYRVEKGRSRESGGTGLGLSIVKHIIGQHGGDIEAWSEAGQGTRIEITLPGIRAEESGGGAVLA